MLHPQIIHLIETLDKINPEWRHPWRTRPQKWYKEHHDNPCIEVCEKIVVGMPNPPRIEKTWRSAGYFKHMDLVTMPGQRYFCSPEEYYHTLFHELIHSTGSPKRLNRDELVESSGLYDPKICLEEIIAEIGAIHLSDLAGIGHKTIDNGLLYIRHYIRQLNNDTSQIVHLSMCAQKAVDYILGSPPKT